MRLSCYNNDKMNINHQNIWYLFHTSQRMWCYWYQSMPSCCDLLHPSFIIIPPKLDTIQCGQYKSLSHVSTLNDYFIRRFFLEAVITSPPLAFQLCSDDSYLVYSSQHCVEKCLQPLSIQSVDSSLQLPSACFVRKIQTRYLARTQRSTFAI